jgi:hypothetical protein
MTPDYNIYMKNFILSLAREAVETYVKTGRRLPVPGDYPKELDEKKGVFVTIYKKPKVLRGCIGLPYSQLPLIEGLIEAATEACRDPRFHPISMLELKDVIIEVSVLTEPELIRVRNPKSYLSKIETGKDGLIIKKGVCSGLFLPQVWEEIPKKEEFLESLCLKAGLLTDEWLDSSARIYKFRVKIFKER